MNETEAVTAAKTMLAQGVEPQKVTTLLVTLDKKVRGKRKGYDKSWWARMTSRTSPESSTPSPT